MRLHALALPVVMYSLVCGAATSIPCESLHDLKKPDPKLCICTESLSKVPITIPEGFSLTAACNFHKPYGEEVLGDYTFRGNVVLSGVIESGADFDSEENGSWLVFSDDRKVPFSQFRSAISALRFRDEVSAEKQFRVPKLTRSSNCLKAPASIVVSVIVAEVGYGTDSEGIFAEQFKVLRVGKYSRCNGR